MQVQNLFQVEVDQCYAETRMLTDTVKKNQMLLDHSWRVQSQVRAVDHLASLVETGVQKLADSTTVAVKEHRATRGRLRELQREEERLACGIERERLVMTARMEEMRKDLEIQRAEAETMRRRCVEQNETIREKDEVIFDYLKRWGKSEEENQEVKEQLEACRQELEEARGQVDRLRKDVEDIKAR